MPKKSSREAEARHMSSMVSPRVAADRKASWAEGWSEADTDLALEEEEEEEEEEEGGVRTGARDSSYWGLKRKPSFLSSW